MREKDRKWENNGSSPKKQKVTDAQVEKDHKEQTEKIGKRKKRRMKKMRNLKEMVILKRSLSMDEAMNYLPRRKLIWEEIQRTEWRTVKEFV